MKTFGLLPENGFALNILNPLLSLLPKEWGHSLQRGLIELPLSLPKELTIKVANTLDEVEEAFEVVHNEYWEHGFIDKKNTEKLITKFHLLPTTSVVIAKWNNEVVGTISLINDSLLGLPSEGLHSFNEYRKAGTQNLAEGAFFAIRENFVNLISWPLIKYFYELASRVHNVDTLILPIPDNRDIYNVCEALFFIKPISEEAYTPHPYLNYGSVRLYQLNYAKVKMQMIKNYWKNPPSKDLLTFLHNTEFSNFEFPSEISQKWTADQLRHFFSENEDLKESLTEFEKLCLKEFYQEPVYENILPPFDPEVIKVEDRRKSKERRVFQPRTINDRRMAFYSREIRFKTDFQGSLFLHKEEFPIKVLDVSLNGLRLECSHALKVGQNFRLKAHIDKNQYFEVQVRNIWAKKHENCYGFRVEETSKTWSQMIHYLIEKEEAS